MEPFCGDLDVRIATPLLQVIMDYVEQFQEKQGDSIASTCRIELPFAVNPDFTEDIITFANNTAALYLLRFCAPDSTSRLEASGCAFIQLRNLRTTVLHIIPFRSN